MYNPTVRIGNWTEEIALEKEKIGEFIKKRQKSQLLVQHTRRVFHRLLQEIRLSKFDVFVKFGSCIQLNAPDMPGFPPVRDEGIKNNTSSTNNYGVVMTATIHDKHIDKISSLVNDCRLLCSPLLVPCVRNSFLIKSADSWERNGDNLLFGQEFVLQTVDSEGPPLYVRAEIPLIDGPHGPRDHNPVLLSTKKDRYCIWKALYWDKEMRFESEGAPFPPFTRVVIRHLMSGIDLAVEGTEWTISIFGNECGLSVYTYLDPIYKRETAECLWMFVTRSSKELSEPSDPKNCED